MRYRAEKERKFLISIGQSRQETKESGKHARDMEVFNGRAKEQLEKLGKLIGGTVEVGRAHVAELVTKDFSCGPLRPESLAKVFEDQVLKIERGVIDLEAIERKSLAQAARKNLERARAKHETSN